MKAANHFIVMLLCLALAAPYSLAQSGQDLQSKQPIAKDVTIIIQSKQVRFVASQVIEQFHLQVTNQSGEVVFDSGGASAQEIFWQLYDANGAPIKSGLYAYTLTVKTANDKEPRVRRGHFIVDRVQDRDNKTDKLWVTSQSENQLGTELTVAQTESSAVAGVHLPIERTSGQATSRPIEQEPVGQGEAAPKLKTVQEMLAAAMAGTSGRIAKFTSANDVGDSVMIEQNGLVGVGTLTPTYKLDVVGTLRAARETSNDIVVQTTGGTNAWARLWMLTPSQAWSWGTSQNFNGNQLYLFDATFNQIRMSIQPNGGEIAFPSPVSNHLVVQTNGGTNAWAQYRMKTPNQTWAMGTSQNFNGDQFYLFDATREQLRLMIQPNGGAVALPLGNVGIGTTNPLTKLHVESTGVVETTIKSPNERAILALDGSAGGQRVVWTMESGLYGTRGLFGIHNRTTNSPGLTIDAAGLVGVKALQITGGADFAEHFDVNVPVAADGVTPAPSVAAGMVVSIDPASPGKLTLSQQAYDRRVAGIISGAGGVSPGMMMSQTGTLADGQHPVALSGRVYCYVDATQGAIEPGDMLTSSATPGHAMKATDAAKAHGAIIGKAMTGLEKGKGLVLVLVTLQ